MPATHCARCRAELATILDRWSLNGEEICFDCAAEAVEIMQANEKEGEALKQAAWEATGKKD